MHRLLFFLILLSLLTGCGITPQAPFLHSEAQYTVRFPSDTSQPINVTFLAKSGTRFILPFHFFDNPVANLCSTMVKNLVVTDAEGIPIATQTSTVTMGVVTNTVISIPQTSVYPVSFAYDLDFSVLSCDEGNQYLPQQIRTSSKLYVSGAYIFILPELSTEPVSLWRTPFSSIVTVKHPASLPVYGIPATTFICENLYELLFLQFSSSKTIAGKGFAGGSEFVLLDLGTANASPFPGDSVAGLFSAVLNRVVPQYGSFAPLEIATHPYTIVLLGMAGGVEGTYGFALNREVASLDNRYTEILAHELLHHYIGVHCGDLDDPWWKEAAASYLGVEIAVELGLYSKEEFLKRMTTRFYAADSLPFKRALSDPWLREHMFPEELFNIVYDRGGTVMMLFDDLIRCGSGGIYTLHSAMALLCRQFSGRAFSRSDFSAILSKFGASGVETIFNLYVDRPDTVPSEATLTAAFNRIDSLASW